MYLFSRRVRLSTGEVAEGMAWATGMAQRVHQLTGLDVSVFTSMFGPEVGTLAFTTMVPDLETLEAAFDKVAVDNGYLEEVRHGYALAPGGADDRLRAIVHPSDQAIADRLASGEMTAQPTYAALVTTTCVPGAFTRAMALGIQITERVTAITEVPTLFLIDRTGTYGTVNWLSGYTDIHQLEQSERALEADHDWLDFLDREVRGVYTDTPGATTQLVYRRVT